MGHGASPHSSGRIRVAPALLPTYPLVVRMIDSHHSLGLGMENVELGGDPTDGAVSSYPLYLAPGLREAELDQQ